MEPLTHPTLDGPRLPRMVGVSAALHLAVLALVVVMDLVRPRPDVFREVMKVDLVAPEAPPEAAVAPPPEAEAEAPPPPPPEAKAPPKPKPPPLAPLRENPLWAKMAELDKPPPPPPPKDTSLAKLWKDVAKTPPKPVRKAPPKPEDLSKWWNDQMAAAAKRPKAPAPPETVKVPERKALSDTWHQINATLPEAVRLGDAELEAGASGELEQWWKTQMEGALAPDQARQMDVASASGTPQYLALIKQRVDARWSPPDIFRDRQEVVVVLAFDLAADGRVRRVRIDRSSGSSFYDQAALRAIYLSDPFPPFPKQVSEPSMQIRMTLSLDRPG